MIKENERTEIGSVETPISFRIHDFEGTKEAVVSIGYPSPPETLYLDIKDIDKLIMLLKTAKNKLRKVI